METPQITLLEANLQLYHKELTRFNRLATHYRKLVKETTQTIDELKEADAKEAAEREAELEE